MLQQLMQKVRGKKSRKWAEEPVALALATGVAETVTDDAAGTPPHCGAWFNPLTPQQAKASLKEQAGSLPHFLPASQLGFSQKQEHMKVKPSILQGLCFLRSFISHIHA